MNVELNLSKDDLSYRWKYEVHTDDFVYLTLKWVKKTVPEFL